MQRSWVLAVAGVLLVGALAPTVQAKHDERCRDDSRNASAVGSNASVYASPDGDCLGGTAESDAVRCETLGMSSIGPLMGTSVHAHVADGYGCTTGAVVE